ncbi:MAG: 2-C-methyl-D-erythritol 2,4-cyclodiphosphate synthase [Acidobacteriota bacterium]|nr:2-C-methyl-D-erythritol 2,4-cyclodiphosphate synthase [Acidobacteriota bacterium]
MSVTARVGIGYDIHRLVEGRRLILGGVRVPFDRGLQGHSDADVLTHSICDALLGAAALGDLGQHFPDTDPQYKNVSSLTLLREVASLVAQHGFTIQCIDATIVTEAPKLRPYLDRMRVRLARALRLKVEAVNIKAKTNEGLGDIGAGRAMAAYAVCLLASREVDYKGRSHESRRPDSEKARRRPVNA